MSKEISALFVYDGSKLLEPLVPWVGLPIDQVNMMLFVNLSWKIESTFCVIFVNLEVERLKTGADKFDRSSRERGGGGGGY